MNRRSGMHVITKSKCLTCQISTATFNVSANFISKAENVGIERTADGTARRSSLIGRTIRKLGGQMFIQIFILMMGTILVDHVHVELPRVQHDCSDYMLLG